MLTALKVSHDLGYSAQTVLSVTVFTQSVTVCATASLFHSSSLIWSPYITKVVVVVEEIARLPLRLGIAPTITWRQHSDVSQQIVRCHSGLLRSGMAGQVPRSQPTWLVRPGLELTGRSVHLTSPAVTVTPCCLHCRHFLKSSASSMTSSLSLRWKVR